MIFKEGYYVDKPKATIIIVHGIAEHSGRYLELVKHLNNENYDCLLYDHLGHGKSGGERGKIKSFHQHIDTLHKMVLFERKRTNNKIFLLGHSMGGGIVNLYGVKYGNIDGIISIAAATNTPNNMKIFKYIGFYLLRWIPVTTKIFKNDLAKDPEVYKKTTEDPLMLDYMYMSLLGEMFIKSVRYLHKNINNLTVPIFYLHGRDDKIVNYKFSKKMYDEIPSLDKQIKLYYDEYHEMLNDYSKELVTEDIIEWLNKRN